MIINKEGINRGFKFGPGKAFFEVIGEDLKETFSKSLQMDKGDLNDIKLDCQRIVFYDSSQRDGYKEVLVLRKVDVVKYLKKLNINLFNSNFVESNEVDLTIEDGFFIKVKTPISKLNKKIDIFTFHFYIDLSSTTYNLENVTYFQSKKSENAPHISMEDGLNSLSSTTLIKLGISSELTLFSDGFGDDFVCYEKVRTDLNSRLLAGTIDYAIKVQSLLNDLENSTYSSSETFKVLKNQSRILLKNCKSILEYSEKLSEFFYHEVRFNHEVRVMTHDISGTFELRGFQNYTPYASSEKAREANNYLTNSDAEAIQNHLDKVNKLNIPYLEELIDISRNTVIENENNEIQKMGKNKSNVDSLSRFSSQTFNFFGEILRKFEDNEDLILLTIMNNNNKLEAYVSFYIDEDKNCFIEMIQVKQSSKRKGYATKLLNFIIEEYGAEFLEGAILNSAESYNFWKDYLKNHDFDLNGKFEDLTISDFFDGDHVFYAKVKN